jgi:hypothetical protein
VVKARQHRQRSGVAQKANRSPVNQTGVEANLLHGRAHGGVLTAKVSLALAGLSHGQSLRRREGAPAGARRTRAGA